MKVTYQAWAIEVQADRPFLAGIFYSEPIRDAPAVSDLLGVRTMVFRTRRQARAAKKRLWHSNATVRRATVTIEADMTRNEG